MPRSKPGTEGITSEETEVAQLGTADRPLRVAIIGSGPSGFYAADALQKAEPVAEVDVFDRLPTPYGLVRGGVAPDHPKIKNVTKVYEKIAGRDGFRFFGNVTIGRDLSIDDLHEHYDAIIACYGAETDRRLGIPGEDLDGSHTATAFVGWYNGHPDYRDAEFDLSSEAAVVIGQGNVAADVSRILCKTVDELKETDIAAHALEVLAESKVRDVYLIGRRGPAQAKFTPPEIRELGRLADCVPVIDEGMLELVGPCQAEVEASSDLQKNMAAMRGFLERERADESKRLHFRFLESPVRIEGDDRVERLVLGKNRLEGETGRQRAVSTGDETVLDCGLVFRSIGYRGRPLEGFPFDDRWGGIPNEAGRALDENGKPIPGCYAAGWIKRGPSGVVGTNKPDSVETVNALLEDLATLPGCASPSSDAVGEKLTTRGVRFVSFDDWRKIDAAEAARGAACGKPREKGTSIDELLGFIDGGVS